MRSLTKRHRMEVWVGIVSVVLHEIVMRLQSADGMRSDGRWAVETAREPTAGALGSVEERLMSPAKGTSSVEDRGGSVRRTGRGIDGREAVGRSSPRRGERGREAGERRERASTRNGREAVGPRSSVEPTGGARHRRSRASERLAMKKARDLLCHRAALVRGRSDGNEASDGLLGVARLPPAAAAPRSTDNMRSSRLTDFL